MGVIILLRNEAFADYLKDSFLNEGFSYVEIASSNDLATGFARLKKIIDPSTKLILDAHITGNMSSCEGFDLINTLRLKFNFKNSIILLTWFNWDHDFKQMTFLKKHLDWFFLYDYNKRSLTDLKIMKLPITSKNLVSELNN